MRWRGKSYKAISIIHTITFTEQTFQHSEVVWIWMWLQQMCVQIQHFPPAILFTDEVMFTVQNFNNTHV